MRYNILGRHTGLRVSELVLGAGMFGTKWGHGADRDESRRVFDGYVQAGGNFIDTSDSYQFGESEALLGEFIESCRDDLVIATKYNFSDEELNDHDRSPIGSRRDLGLFQINFYGFLQEFILREILSG